MSAELVAWLRDQENIPAEPQEIVATGKTLDYYIGYWGTVLFIWRGDGHFILIADYGDLRAVAVFYD